MWGFFDLVLIGGGAAAGTAVAGCRGCCCCVIVVGCVSGCFLWAALEDTNDGRLTLFVGNG